MSKIKKGSYIYYLGIDSIPAVVLKECKKTFKIRGDFLEYPNIRYVKKSNCILQDEVE